MAKKTTVRSGNKRSKSKAKSARNGCCPIISHDCRETYTIAKLSDGKKERISAGKKCTVRLGNTVKARNLDLSATKQKIDQLKNALTAKRCLAVVESANIKRAERISIAKAKKVESAKKRIDALKKQYGLSGVR